MPTKKLKRGLRHSKKLRGGAGFLSSLFETKSTNPGPNTVKPNDLAVKPNALAVKPNAPNAPLTIEEKINKINQRLDALEAKLK